jgi:hypothetical protein
MEIGAGSKVHITVSLRARQLPPCTPGNRALEADRPAPACSSWTALQSCLAAS